MNPTSLLPSVGLALGALLLLPATGLRAQSAGLSFPAASPPATVTETFGLTTVEIQYARPSVRERQIFGGLVPYGEVWRTGANAATRISFSTDVSFGGEAVEAGTYALFTIPGEREWTVILNEAPEQWGSYAYDASKDVLRVTAPAQKLAEPVETMRLGLEHLRDDAALLTLSWERTRVQVPLEVDLVAQLVPQIEAAMAAPGDEKPYLSAAMFYYEHDLDLEQAVAWIDAALAQQPQAVWILYRKGLILAKHGDKDGARAAAQKAVELADGLGGELGIEYKRLSEALLKRL